VRRVRDLHIGAVWYDNGTRYKLLRKTPGSATVEIARKRMEWDTGCLPYREVEIERTTRTQISPLTEVG
jgi:hypothetical protein